MKRLFTLLFVMVPLFSVAQSRLYGGNSTYSSDIICTIKGCIPIAVLAVMM